MGKRFSNLAFSITQWWILIYFTGKQDKNTEKKTNIILYGQCPLSELHEQWTMKNDICRYCAKNTWLFIKRKTIPQIVAGHVLDISLEYWMLAKGSSEFSTWDPVLTIMSQNSWKVRSVNNNKSVIRITMERLLRKQLKCEQSLSVNSC